VRIVLAQPSGLSRPSYYSPFFFSIGNFLLAAAQSFFRSLPSAIFLFSSITNSQVRRPSIIFSVFDSGLDTGEHHSGDCGKSYRYHRSWAGQYVYAIALVVHIYFRP
jgi:hypothetical protein